MGATRSQPFPVLRGGTEVVLEGGQLARGDILMTSSGTSEVASLTNTTLSEKRLIETRAGTVFVNGILASTGVADPTPQLPWVLSAGEFSTMVNVVAWKIAREREAGGAGADRPRTDCCTRDNRWPLKFMGRSPSSEFGKWSSDESSDLLVGVAVIVHAISWPIAVSPI